MVITSECIIPPSPIPIKYLSVEVGQTFADPEECLSLPFMDAGFSGIRFGINYFHFKVKPEIMLINNVPTWKSLSFSFIIIVSFVVYINKGFSIVMDVHCRIGISGWDERSMDKYPETSIVLYFTKIISH